MRPPAAGTREWRRGNAKYETEHQSEVRAESLLPNEKSHRYSPRFALRRRPRDARSQARDADCSPDLGIESHVPTPGNPRRRLADGTSPLRAQIPARPGNVAEPEAGRGYSPSQRQCRAGREE